MLAAWCLKPSAAVARCAVGLLGGLARGPGPSAAEHLRAWGGGAARGTSATVRRRRRALYRALNDSNTSPTKLKRLRERAAQPSFDLLRHIAENKIGKATTMGERKSLWYDLRYRKYAPVFLGQVKPRMKFWTAALEESQLPPARLPEVALCGRSNSGKSTMVNYLCGHHSAHVKRTPGSTTEVVFWQIGKPATLCLVDLPGYGFAEAPEERRLQWTEFTLWYVRSRRNLRRVLMLVDARAGLKPTDKEMIAYLERHNVPWQIVMTKCDKVLKKTVAKRITIMKDELSGYRKMAGDPIPVSALKRKGMDSLREVLESFKVRKEVIKDGIRRRIYDLLEVKRLRRIERADKKRAAKEEARRLEEEEQQRQADVASALAGGAGPGGGASDGVDEAFGAPARAPRTPLHPDLHKVLDDWGIDLGIGGQGLAGGGKASKGGGGAEQKEDAVEEPKPIVTEAYYSLEDRDSRRAQRLFDGLFPGAASDAQDTDASIDAFSSAASAFGAGPLGAALRGGGSAAAPAASAFDDAGAFAPSSSSSSLASASAPSPSSASASASAMAASALEGAGGGTARRTGRLPVEEAPFPFLGQQEQEQEQSQRRRRPGDEMVAPLGGDADLGPGFRTGGSAGGPGLGHSLRRPPFEPALFSEAQQARFGDDREVERRKVEDSESESDDEEPSVRPSVLRFDRSLIGHAPPPRRPRGSAGAGLFGGGSSSSSASPSSASPFPGFQKAPAYAAVPPPTAETAVFPGGEGGVTSAAEAEDRRRARRERTVGLRPDWLRPNVPDKMYDQDDFASEEDRAAGLRPFAPPAPSMESRGSLLAEARRRYEREWAMELEDVDESRSPAADSLRAGLRRGAKPPSGDIYASAMAEARTAAELAARRSLAENSGPGRGSKTPLVRKFLDRTGSTGRYITKEGSKAFPRGAGLWRVLGRPPPRIFKKKNMPDAARALGLVDRKGRKRNLGSGISYETAKEKWTTWYRKNRKKNPEQVMEAASPKREDVEADYQERMLRRPGARRFLQKQRQRGPFGRFGQEGPDSPGAQDEM